MSFLEYSDQINDLRTSRRKAVIREDICSLFHILATYFFIVEQCFKT